MSQTHETYFMTHHLIDKKHLVLVRIHSQAKWLITMLTGTHMGKQLHQIVYDCQCKTVCTQLRLVSIEKKICWDGKSRIYQQTKHIQDIHTQKIFINNMK